MTINSFPPIHAASGGTTGTSIADEFMWTGTFSIATKTPRSSVPTSGFNLSAFEGKSNIAPYWIHMIGGAYSTTGSPDQPYVQNFVLDSDDSIYAIAYSGTGYATSLIKFDKDGFIQLSYTVSGNSSSSTSVISGSYVFFNFYPYIICLNKSDFSQVWTKYYAGGAQVCTKVLASSGELLIGTGASFTTYYRIYLAKVTAATGVVAANVSLDVTVAVLGLNGGGILCTDSSNNIYYSIGVVTSTSFYTLVLKYNSSLVLQWQVKLTGFSSSQFFTPYSLYVDSTGTLYGRIYGTYYNFMFKIDSSGTVLTSRYFNGYGIGQWMSPYDNGSILYYGGCAIYKDFSMIANYSPSTLNKNQLWNAFAVNSSNKIICLNTSIVLSGSGFGLGRPYVNMPYTVAGNHYTAPYESTRAIPQGHIAAIPNTLGVNSIPAMASATATNIKWGSPLHPGSYYYATFQSEPTESISFASATNFALLSMSALGGVTGSATLTSATGSYPTTSYAFQTERAPI